ncbi:hypothetical protein HRbin04_00508 [archaeon HR04]|nr:hypothetical protein HRbin04_00508 [archaeon HR04]
MVMDARLLISLGFALVLIGMIIVAFAMLRRIGSLQGRGRSMGFILLGPIPIVWQGSRSLLLIVPIALLIAIIFFIMVSMR